MADTEPYRAGFACFVGRPNAGKSTLTNAIIGSKIAITSNRPQTTRHVIRGILHQENSQLILVDTPGLHRPRTLLGQRLNDLVRQTWTEVDAIGLCIPANEKVGPGDRFITREITDLRAKVIAVVTKADLVSKDELARQLMTVQELGEFADIVPCSATTGENIDAVTKVLSGHLPESPQLYPDGMITEEPERVLMAEMIREAALEGVKDELPHSIAVVIEDIEDEEVDGSPRKRIFAEIFVERNSQKSIVIGRRGERLKRVGTKARKDIAKLVDQRVYLDLHVRVAKEWQRDPKLLRRLGF
ncbi:GTPase Era [Natronoglycomyces albus]|uniref:GTPase Era n=1 Tax=Natronoglycomyces albus TaxID=2811108 RepID=A0A895XHQ2_9ACTN|nr:GTPase Era [Natronoglycomyces albus]QSB04467.1 GTPase Era [Natronoglycomyces albus]